MDTIFEISALENPRVPNFLKIGQLLVFGHFLGGLPPKTKFFRTKKIRTKILKIFLDSEPSKTFVYQISATSEDI